MAAEKKRRMSEDPFGERLMEKTYLERKLTEERRDVSGKEQVAEGNIQYPAGPSEDPFGKRLMYRTYLERIRDK